MKTFLKTISIVLIAFFISSCSSSMDDDDAGGGNNNGVIIEGITVKTIDITNIKTILATVNSKVDIDPTKATLAVKGIVWSTVTNPTISLSTKTIENNTSGSFQSFTTDLQHSTKYYVRAYATDTKGNTTYGNEISFTTKVGWKIVESSFQYSLAIKEDGSLWGWGKNSYGQLGNGTSINQNSPVQIGTDHDWKSLSTSGAEAYGYTLAIKNDGTLWSWGKNADGRLGDGTNIDKFIPTKISNEIWSQVSAGTDFSIGIKSDGTVWAWGQVWRLNDYYNTTGLYINVKTPLQLTEISNCKSLFSGQGYAIFLKNNGTLWGWGRNNDDALGFGVTTTNTYQPLQQIGTKNDWLNLFCKNFTSIVTKSDGTAWGWGNGNQGQFGDGTNSNKIIPTQISDNLGANSLMISKSSNFSSMTYYVKKDGTLWGTGAGLLGDNTTYGNSRFVFTQAGTLNTWKYVNLGSSCNFAIQTNGSLWVWGGDNNSGQLGIGDSNSSTQKLAFTLVE